MRGKNLTHRQLGRVGIDSPSVVRVAKNLRNVATLVIYAYCCFLALSEFGRAPWSYSGSSYLTCLDQRRRFIAWSSC